MGRAAGSRAEGDTDALEELRFHWGDAYHIAAGRRRARRGFPGSGSARGLPGAR